MIKVTLDLIDGDPLAQHLGGTPMAEIVGMNVGEPHFFCSFLDHTPGSVSGKGFSSVLRTRFSMAHEERRGGEVGSLL